MSGLGVKRKEISKHRVSIGDGPRSCGRLFLDSGAFGLYRRYVTPIKARADRFKWFAKEGKLTKRFRRYLDGYAEFVKKYSGSIDLYATIDVILNPELSWQSYQYLRDQGLKPLPVIHLNTDLKWVDKYTEAGCQYVGVGGVGQGHTQEEYVKWADKLFRHLCPGPTFIPCIKTHAFAVTAVPLMTRYPWYSVDSSRWAKAAGYGSILVPNKVNGGWSFEFHHKRRKPYLVCMSHRKESYKRAGPHYGSLPPDEQKVVLEWLEEIGVPLGRYRGKKKRPEYGVFTFYNARAKANLLFFHRLAKWIGPYPQPFTRHVPGKGLFE